MSTAQQEPMRLAIVNDYEMVVAGVAAMLAPHFERVAVVELDSRMPVVSDVDVILYDTFGQVQGDSVDLSELVAGTEARVVIFSWNTQPDLVQRALEKGAAGYLSKAMTAEEIVDALESIRGGVVITPASIDTEGRSTNGVWPGREVGLTAREAEVLALITQGLSNQEIAERSYLSINSVKTYIRTAYRKINVTRRAQAVVWGMKHGFEPDHVRSLDDGTVAG
jgi:two-component system, NarL family, response regulator LiaR